METINPNLILLLNGQDIEESQDYCDFSLEEQNEIAVAKGQTPSAPPDFIPKLKQSVCYVVMAVIFNDNNDILMMQEAKSTCSGQWYLPAGRVEPKENLTDAFKREVLEETGLLAEPSTLLMVESAAGSWYRFVLAGNVVGGSLKTPSQADSESLQAKWISKLSELTLRAVDIIPIVDHALSVKTQLGNSPSHPPLLPTARSYSKLYLRLIICARSKTNNQVHVLVSEKTAAHLPICEIHPGRSLHATLKKFMTEMFGADLPSHRPHGVLALGHCYQPEKESNSDGLGLTLLVSVRMPLEEVGLIDKYSWVKVSETVAANLLSRMGKFRTVPLNVVRTSESNA